MMKKVGIVTIHKINNFGAVEQAFALNYYLRKLGYDVTIFEKENFLGGILMYGIPDYRLSKKIVTEVIEDLLELGIKVELNTILLSNDCVQEDFGNKNLSRKNHVCSEGC
jgi:NADPH-dependent glutamate synthase beta subunit-like oxidoreductase